VDQLVPRLSTPNTSHPHSRWPKVFTYNTGSPTHNINRLQGNTTKNCRRFKSLWLWVTTGIYVWW